MIENEVWVIEDQAKEIDEFYLAPIHEIMKEYSLPQGERLVVNIFAIGEGAQSRYDLELTSRNAKEVYPDTLKVLSHYPAPSHESNEENLLSYLADAVKPADLVFVDGTMSSRNWPGNDYHALIADKLREARPAQFRDRVLIVTNWPRYQVGFSQKDLSERASYIILKPKFGKEQDYERYVQDFRKNLRIIIPARSPSDGSFRWMRDFNKNGEEKVFRPLRELTPDVLERVRKHVGYSSSLALCHLMWPRPDSCPTIRKAAGDNLEPRPEIMHRLGLSANLLEQAQLHSDLDQEALAELKRILIQRRILLGLRRIWESHSPAIANFGLWLEVAAAGYDWYDLESYAVHSMLAELRSGEFEECDGAIALGNLSFRGKDRILVDKFYIRNRPLPNLRKDKIGSLLFIEAALDYPYQGETEKSKVYRRCKFYYQIRFQGKVSRIPPEDSGSKEWGKFWDENGERFRVDRKGRVEELQQLASKSCFRSRDIMLKFNHGMPEEERWWGRYGSVFLDLIDSEILDPAVLCRRRRGGDGL